MLYVFHLDAGRLISFDPQYANSNVIKLKEAIQGALSASAVDQILLVNGGEVLDCSKKVATYGAGFDPSNPIFLICKCDLGSSSTTSNTNLSRSIGGGKYKEVFCESQASRELEPAVVRQQKTQVASLSYQTIQCNAQLAGKFLAAADELLVSCSRLVDEQHLMHQGWCAVTANLDDTTAAFVRRLKRFDERRQKFEAHKSNAIDLLDNFQADLNLLKRVPLLSCLSDHSPPCSSTSLDGHERRKSISELSLYDWISSKEPDGSLQQLAADVRRCLDEVAGLDAKLGTCQGVEQWRHAVEERVSSEQMKQIKGLGERLHQLNKGLDTVRAKIADQKLLVNRVVAKEQETLNTRDLAKLVDVCHIQFEDLNTLLRNHKRLIDIAKRFFDAKNELLENIRVRLQWVSDCHQIIQSGDSKVLLNSERIRKLRRQLELLRQIHDAPNIYALTVVEVMRRRLFSAEFLEWAKVVVEKTRDLRVDEHRMRRCFMQKFERHFLRCMFKGMDDCMPEFCMEVPKQFDANLPQVELHHVREIRASVPNLANQLQVLLPQVFQRMSIADPQQAANNMQQSLLKREASFLIAQQTPPRVTSALAGAIRRPSGSSLSLNDRHFGSPTWTSTAEDDNSSPSPFGGLFTTGAYSDTDIEEHNDRRDDVASPANTFYSITSSAGNASRSAPIAIPARHHSGGGGDSAPPHQLSHRFYSSPDDNHNGATGNLYRFDSCPPAEFGTDDSQQALAATRRRQQRALRNFSSASLSNLTPLGEEAAEDSADGRQRHASSQADLANDLRFQLERNNLQLQQCLDREEKLKNRMSTLRGCVEQRVASLKDELSSLRTDLMHIAVKMSDFGEASRHGASRAGTTLLEAARRLELNLQSSWAEAARAAEQLHRDQMQPEVDKLKDELEKEKISCRDTTKRLENCQAYLTQKDDVIELLQQQIDDGKVLWQKSIEQTRSEVAAKMVLEHEVDLDNTKAQLNAQLQQKEAENRFLAKQLDENNQTLKQIQKTQNRLVMSMFEQTSDCKVNSLVHDLDNIESLRLSDDEVLNRIQSWRHEVENQYEQKFKLALDQARCEHEKALDEVRISAMLNQKSNLVIEKVDRAVSAADEEFSTTILLDENCMNQSTTNFVAHENHLNATDEANAISIYCAIEEASQDVVSCSDLKSPTDSEKENQITSQIHTISQNIDDNQTLTCVEQSTNFITNETCQNFVHLTTSHRFTQTKPPAQQVSVVRLHKGDLVLLIFDLQKDCFIVYTVSPMLYILKESSAQKMSLQKPNNPTNSTIGGTSPQVILARLIDLDFCQIKKENNRYNLPMNTRFYRVSVQKCDIAFMGTTDAK